MVDGCAETKKKKHEPPPFCRPAVVRAFLILCEIDPLLFHDRKVRRLQLTLITSIIIIFY